MPENSSQPPKRINQPELDLLLCTARLRMTPGIANQIRAAVRDEVNWINLIALAIQHETTTLLYWNLKSICPESVPLGILEPLAARYRAQATEAEGRAKELVRILDTLESRRIFALAYKGPILSQRLYGNLSLREFSEYSDLDIMIRERDLAKAEDVIRSHGYRKPVRGERELIFCREYGGPRALELHWRFMTESSRLHGDPERFLRRFERVSLAGRTVQSLPLEVYFLILSLHATKHKWRKLKLICDVGQILESVDVDWDYVVHEAKEMGLQRMLAVGVLLAEDPLMFVTPTMLTRRLKIDRVARILAQECRQELFKEADETWRQHADLRFLFRMHERLCDRAGIFFWSWLWPKTMPDERDRRFATIPVCLAGLYYFVRPVRLAWEKITGRL